MSRENAENVVELHPSDTPSSQLPEPVEKISSNVARLAYTKAETAECLGVSVDFVDDHVWSELKLVRWGRKTLAPVREIEALLERKAARVLD